MYSNLTSVSNLYHIQSKSCSKSGRTTLRLIVLEGQKHGGATKLRVPVITGFNCCVSIASNCCKNAPTVSHSGNTKNAYLLRCDAVSSRDSFRNLRKHEDLSNHRKSLIEQKKVTKLKTQFLRMQFAFTLYFTGHILVTLYSQFLF